MLATENTAISTDLIVLYKALGGGWNTGALAGAPPRRFAAGNRSATFN